MGLPEGWGPTSDSLEGASVDRPSGPGPRVDHVNRRREGSRDLRVLPAPSFRRSRGRVGVVTGPRNKVGDGDGNGITSVSRAPTSRPTEAQSHPGPDGTVGVLPV